MPATNYTKPASGDYRLIRIRKCKAQILDPDILGEILSILELNERRDLWDALYYSQPFHSEQVDDSGAYWRQGHPYMSEHEIPQCFLWAAASGRL